VSSIDSNGVVAFYRRGAGAIGVNSAAFSRAVPYRTIRQPSISGGAALRRWVVHGGKNKPFAIRL
jgi:hypothetical protein